MVTQLMDNIYQIEVPLTGNPLGWLNSYLIKGNERSLIIDTGFNRQECKDALMAGLQELNVDFDKTDIFLTHLHADHSGLMFSIKTPANKVYCHRLTAQILSNPQKDNYWNDLVEMFQKSGLRMDKEEAVRTHPGFRWKANQFVELTPLEDGSKLSVGQYNFTCVWTPGHSPGHLCLYEPDYKLLFAGDMILGDITPNLCLEKFLDFPLTEYLKSLDKVEQLEIKKTFVGHQGMVEDVYARIKELREHHNERCQEVLQVLRSGPKDAWEAAAQMTWDIDAENWDGFPPSQKWFATGEAQAHLLYLWQQGKVERKFREDGVNYFVGKE